MRRLSQKRLIWPCTAAIIAAGYTLLLDTSLAPQTFGPKIIIFLFPGLLGSMALSGNVHAFSLRTAAILNGFFYFGAIWAIGTVAVSIKRRRRIATEPSASSDDN